MLGLNVDHAGGYISQSRRTARLRSTSCDLPSSQLGKGELVHDVTVHHP